MELTRRQIGSVLVLEFAEPLSLEGDSSALFKEKIRGLVGEGRSSLVIDMGRVAFIDSAGLGSLISALKALRANGGDLKLANIGEQVYSVLEMTRLLRVFDTYETSEDALSALEKHATLGA